ncbi:MAG: CoB--CoM heterodisulfide reductase subunit B [Spirochaetales bacterium]|nr:MAG: CoB--CoM heterodisulfide reductase subunit B [Spirochaetales bacterium]
MKAAFFSGCVIPVKYPGIEAATRYLAGELGIGLVDIEFGCCPAPTGLKSIHFDSWLTLASRNLFLAEEKGLDIVTLCSGCTNTLREAGHILAGDEEKRELVKRLLAKHGKAHEGKVKVVNLVEILARDEFLDLMEAKRVRSLDGIKYGTHYGCHYFRPGDVMQDGEPDPRFPLPESMELILEALGAQVIPFGRQDMCCGAALSLNTGRNEEALEITKEKLFWMNDAGIEALAVPCPTCLNQFDMGQVMLKRAEKTENIFPVYHIAELVAYALGADPQILNLSSHKVPAAIF